MHDSWNAHIQGKRASKESSKDWQMGDVKNWAEILAATHHSHEVNYLGIYTETVESSHLKNKDIILKYEYEITENTYIDLWLQFLAEGS